MIETLQLPDTNRILFLDRAGTISRSGRHDLLLQKIVVLASHYSQCYSAKIWYMNTTSLQAPSGPSSREVLIRQSEHDYVKTTKTLSLFRNFRGACQGPGRELR